jgi:hypothetical protein
VEVKRQNRDLPVEDPMTTNKCEWPVLVRLGLLGIANQTMAWILALGSFTIGAAFFLAGGW